MLQERGQVIGDIFELGVVQLPRESFPGFHRGLKEYLVHVCLPIHTSDMSKQ